MTTSVSNAEVSVVETQLETTSPDVLPARSEERGGVYRIRHTLASRFAFLVICIAIVLSALAYGTVHYWALALFNLGALTVLILWIIDGWQLRSFRISRNFLQLPLIGTIVLGSVQFFATLSLDLNSTRLLLAQFATLLIYFAATLVFVDTPHRLQVLVRTIMIFGFCLAIFGLTQSFTSPTKVYWIRELNQSTAFGPFINRHHFAGYMELTIALPLGLLLAGAIEREKQLLYLFVAGLMGVALVMTTSRGGIISLVAEIVFLVIVTAIWRKRGERKRRSSRLKSVGTRVALAAALIVGLFLGVIALGGEFSVNRFIDSVNTDDPTTGRAHFWAVTIDIIKAHPVVGTGLGAYGVVYTKYDTRNGLFRLEQAHNDYLQVFSDAGIVGGVLALSFVLFLFYRGFVRARSRDDFRRGVALAALGGCFAVLVHSFFDFTLHTPSNALLFLVLAALATMNGRVENGPRRRRRRTSSGDA
jgi:O-antigen ligase